MASALRSDTASRSAPTGLTTKSMAPARMAVTTLSMPPWAVCTITGTARPRVAHARQHAEAVEIGHHEVEHDRVDARAVGAGEQRRRRVAALGDHRLVACAGDHALQEPPLHRIVVDDENPLRHDATPTDCTELGHCGGVGLRAVKAGSASSFSDGR